MDRISKGFVLFGASTLILVGCGGDTVGGSPIEEIPSSSFIVISSSAVESSSSIAISSSAVESSSSIVISSSAVESSSSIAISSSAVESSSSQINYGEFSLDGYTKDSFKNPDITYQTMTDDRDGHVYRIVTVGTGDSAQTWMAENLNFEESTTDSALSANLKNQTSCPLGKAENCEIAGRIYTWTASMNISEPYKDDIAGAKKILTPRNHQGVCPTGWHIPRIDEYVQLVHRIEEIPDAGPYGKALKAKVGWDTLSPGTDVAGLSFIPMRSTEDAFFGYTWAADFNNGIVRFELYSGLDGHVFVGSESEFGAYVRCVKNKDVATGRFKDSRDGKYYKYADIGNTRWMAENLNYGGDELGVCFWDDDEECSGNGRYYTYEEARKACPTGWRLPTDDDFEQLEEDVGGWKNAAVYLRSTEWDGDLPGLDVYGFAAKATGHFDWATSYSSTTGTQPSIAFRSGSFAMWVSSYGSINGRVVYIYNFSPSSFNITDISQDNKLPIRCIR